MMRAVKLALRHLFRGISGVTTIVSFFAILGYGVTFGPVHPIICAALVTAAYVVGFVMAYVDAERRAGKPGKGGPGNPRPLLHSEIDEMWGIEPSRESLEHDVETLKKTVDGDE